MLDALKLVWEERSDNFYDNYLKIKLFILTIQYVVATGDWETWQTMYGLESENV